MLDLRTQLNDYLDDVVQRIDVEDLVERRVGSGPVMPLEPRPLPRTTPTWVYGLAAAAAVLLIVGGVAWLSRASLEPSVADTPPTTAAPSTTTPPASSASVPSTTSVLPPQPPLNIVPTDALELPAPGRTVATAGTPLPDIQSAVDAEPGTSVVRLESVDDLVGDRLDFLFEICDPAGACARDAHFMDPSDPMVGSGAYVPGRPFHIRHGFPVSGDALPAGFDVVVYTVQLDAPGEFGGRPISQVSRRSAHHVLRGEASACGPTYGTQLNTTPCEWFVHEFPNGLPVGRWAIWVVWEAPCSAWVEYGLAQDCPDPNKIESRFSSGVDSPFDARLQEPAYTERNMAGSRP